MWPEGAEMKGPIFTIQERPCFPSTVKSTIPFYANRTFSIAPNLAGF